MYVLKISIFWDIYNLYDVLGLCNRLSMALQTNEIGYIRGFVDFGAIAGVKNGL